MKEGRHRSGATKQEPLLSVFPVAGLQNCGTLLLSEATTDPQALEAPRQQASEHPHTRACGRRQKTLRLGPDLNYFGEEDLGGQPKDLEKE